MAGKANNFEWESLADAKPTKDFSWEDFPEVAKRENRIPATPVTSAIRGAEQGATLGFSDEIRGAIGALKDVSTDDKYHLSDIVARYGVNRDEARAMLEKARLDNPKSYTAGEVGGSTLTSFLPGVGALGAAKGATALARAARAAGGGAILGGLTGLGTSQADLTKGDIDGAVNDVGSGAKTGAIAGGLITPAFEGIAQGVKKFISPENLQGIANERAVKAVTGQNIAALRKMAGSSTSGQDFQKTQAALNRTGKELLDSGVISAGDTVKDLAPKLASKRIEIGGQIGEVGKTLDDLVPSGAISGDALAGKLEAYADTIPTTIQGKNLAERIRKEAENFRAQKNLTFDKANDFKQQFKYKPQDQDALISNQDVTNKIRGLIGDEMDNAVTNATQGASPEVGAILGNYGKLKNKYATFVNSSAAGDRALKDLSNRFISPSDYGAGATSALGAALATGGSAIPAAALGAVGAGLNKLARERGNSIAAVGFSKAAQAMENSPEFAQKFGNILYQSAQRGGPALAVTHQLLSKSFPEYNRMLQQQQ